MEAQATAVAVLECLGLFRLPADWCCRKTEEPAPEAGVLKLQGRGCPVLSKQLLQQV